jgi:hypothetical protein
MKTLCKLVDHSQRPDPGKNMKLYSKITKEKSTGGMPRVVEHLPGQCEGGLEFKHPVCLKKKICLVILIVIKVFFATLVLYFFLALLSCLLCFE